MFGKDKLRDKINKLEVENEYLHKEKESLLIECERNRSEFNKVSDAYCAIKNAYCDMKKKFPFNLGDTVYDLELRNEKGRYAKKNPSFEHSLINEVVVTKNNYFNLIERMENLDVFFDRESAEVILKKKCGIEA